jgi:integrase/recombinase XerC
MDEQMQAAATTQEGSRRAAVEFELRRLRNQERSQECGYHLPGRCPAQQPRQDCGCTHAPRSNKTGRRTGPAPLDPACRHNHPVASELLSGACPAEVGAQVIHAGYYEWPWSTWPHLPAGQLFLWRAVVADPTLEEALALITGQWRRQSEFGDLSPLSLAKLGGNAAQYVAYARATGRHTLREADDAELAGDWVHADVRIVDGYGAPQLPTLHNRRTALRLLFRTARSLDLAAGDPTLDMQLPVRQYQDVRRLEDAEVSLCRSESVETPWETAQPAAWALAELGATTAEIATFASCDLRDRAVYLHGGAHTRPRIVAAGEWQWEQLTGRRAAQQQRHDFDEKAPLIYRGSRSGRTDTSPVSAGYTQNSVTAWAGRRAYEERQHVEDAANYLGLTSLDRTAQVIGYDWAADSDPIEHTGSVQDTETAL